MPLLDQFGFGLVVAVIGAKMLEKRPFMECGSSPSPLFLNGYVRSGAAYQLLRNSLGKIVELKKRPVRPEMRRSPCRPNYTNTSSKDLVPSALVGRVSNPYGRKECPGPVWFIAEVWIHYLKSCYAADTQVDTGNLDGIISALYTEEEICI
jgi:hypothetical protein